MQRSDGHLPREVPLTTRIAPPTGFPALFSLPSHYDLRPPETILVIRLLCILSLSVEDKRREINNVAIFSMVAPEPSTGPATQV